MKNEIYVCEAPYNIYIPLIKSAINNKKGVKNIFILTDIISDNENLIPKLKNLSFIDDVIYVKYKYYAEHYILKNHNKKISKILNLIKLRSKLLKIFDHKFDFYGEHIALFCNSTVNLFWGYHPLSRYLMIKHDNIRFIEEGNGIYYTNRKFINIKRLVRKVIKLPDINGGDTNVKEIEVSYPTKLVKHIQHKAIKLDLKELESKIDVDTKKQIASVYFDDELIEKMFFNKSAIIITQPFSEDGEMTEDSKVQIYREMIHQLKTEKLNIMIKSHPRETTDYRKCFSDASVQVLPKEFPLELLNLVIPQKIDIGITVSSTALKNLDCVERKIFKKEI